MVTFLFSFFLCKGSVYIDLCCVDLSHALSTKRLLVIHIEPPTMLVPAKVVEEKKIHQEWIQPLKEAIEALSTKFDEFIKSVHEKLSLQTPALPRVDPFNTVDFGISFSSVLLSLSLFEEL